MFMNNENSYFLQPYQNYTKKSFYWKTGIYFEDLNAINLYMQLLIIIM